jgi:hypothetical protein
VNQLERIELLLALVYRVRWYASQETDNATCARITNDIDQLLSDEVTKL